MRKKVLVGIILATFLLAVAVPVLAGYYANLQVVESSGNSYDQVALNQTIDIDYLADNGYITSTGLDTRVTSGGTAIPHMLAEDRLLFVTDITAYGTANLLFTTGNTALSRFPVITGYGGNVTISDHANLELGNNFSIEFEGYIDIAQASDLVIKNSCFNVSTSGSNLLASVGTDGYYYKESLYEDDWVVGYSNSGGTQSKESNYLYLTATDVDSERTWVTDSAVNLTDIDTIYVDWENTGQADGGNQSYLIASTSKTGDTGTSDAYEYTNNQFSRQTEDFSVSGLSGNHYIRGHAYSSNGEDSELKVYNVYGRYTDGTVEVIATGVSSGSHLVRVYTNGTNLKIDVDGVTEDEDIGVFTQAYVVDNSNNWIISMPYFNCYNHTVGVNHRIRYEPDAIIVGTALPNEESPGTYDGVITWGANPSGVAVSISGLISDFQPQPAGGASQFPTPQDVAGPSGQPGWTAGIQSLTTHPLYPLVLAVSDQSNIPVPIVWVLGATLILAMVMVWMIGDRQILHQMLIALAGGGWTAFCYHMGIYPFWVIYIYAVLALAIIIGERSPTVS